MDTQTQIERLIELAIVQRTELRELVEQLPTLREHLNAEIERTFEEAEPQIRTELEEFCRARATDEHAKTGAALAAKVEQLSKQLEVTTAAKYSVLMAERAENVNLLAKAEARIEDAASMLTHAVKEIVTDELSRFPRAGEIDQLRKEFAEPRGLNPRGRWMPDETYQRLDLVTINGDSFVSNIDGNRERPSRTAGDWTLNAARGNGGGGGVTSLTDLVSVPTNGQLLIGNGSAFVNSTLTAGTGISISNGAGSITINATDGNITLDDGTAAAPSLNYTNYPTTGLYSSAANAIGFATSGVARAAISSTGLAVTGTITPTGSVHAAAGSVGNPSLAFDADQDTGLFRIGANNLGVAAGGAKVLDVATTGLGVTGTLSVSGVATLGAGAILNTPASGTLTNATGLPISTGVSGLGANVAAFLATPTSANLAAALTDETGTGANVFATSPTLTTPISATLTSPASTNLTLGTGTSGAAITVLSASNNVGIGTITPAAKLDILRTGNTGNQIRTVDDDGITPAIRTYSTADGDGLILNQYYAVAGSPYLRNADFVASMSDSSATQMRFFTKNVSTNPAVAMVIDKTGVVSISSSTAGSAGAGALVVTGGLATGAASYFGGVVTTNNAFKLNTGSGGTALVGIAGGGNSLLNIGTDNAGILTVNLQSNSSTGTAASNAFTVTGGASTATTLLAVTHAGNATFAGAVTVGGNIGFYNNAPVAKPTGVAVTAAAIHAALVTLNLISA